MRQLSIRSRIVAFQLIVAAAVLLMGGGVFIAFRSLDYYSERSAWSREQLDEITELDAGFNRYSEQIAELLLIGESERRDFESARAEFEEDMIELERATEGERNFLGNSLAAAEARTEQDRLERINALYDEMNAEAERLSALRGAGQQEQAVQEFRRGIEDRLDAELEDLVAAAVEDEIEEVEAADEQVKVIVARLTAVVVGALVVALAASVGFGFLLYRSIARPIHRLTEGATALGYGDLSYRVGNIGSDEFGLLASRFDDMAAQLRDQRSLLLKSQLQLEEQVRERTEELERANRRLQALDRSRVQLFADISHELRTPLTVLRGEAEVTLRRMAAHETVLRDTLERIVDQARDMARLVDDLMFLARSEADEIRIERERLELAPLVDEGLHEAQILARAKDVTISRANTNGDAVLLGDRQRLKQTLMILLDNAVKYSERGSVVSIDLSEAGGHAILIVRNRSNSIALEDLPYLFDRFYRGRGIAGQDAVGSGLGLPIAKWIVERHGGSIALTRAPDGNTEVTIRLPLHLEATNRSRIEAETRAHAAA
jgi:two-component system, OmpR family, sensor kinase